MSWSIVTTTAILFVACATCVPLVVDEPATELLPPKADDVDDGPTLATDLVPPPLPTDLVPPALPEDDQAPREKRVPATLFLINVFAVKNSTAEDSNDVLHDDVIKEVPDEHAEPLAMFLLVVEDDDEDHPVSLDEVAKDLEEEGFTVSKVAKDGETRIIKVDLNSADSLEKVSEDKDNELIERMKDIADEVKVPATTEEPPLEESGKLMKIRRKRHICLKCKLEELKASKFGTYGGGGYGGGGGCGGGCGGGGSYYQPQPVQVQPVVVIPVSGGGGGHKKNYGGGGCGSGNCGGGGGYYPQPHPQPVYQPPPQTCNTCGGGGGGYGGGNSHASAQASASASAQASSNGGYGGY